MGSLWISAMEASYTSYTWQMKQLDSKAVWSFFFGSSNLLLMVIVLVIWFSSFFIDFREGDSKEFSLEFLDWLWIIVPVALILLFVWSKLAYHFYRYELTDVGFRKELGVIYKVYVTIPYDRIQNVDIYRGILERILGLSTLNIQTAGAGGVVGAEGRLPGLSREVAEQLRDELIQRARQSKNQGL